jgi:2-(1,2-epoxy-1,2-dihydrophenyl)acetyl-CoA isomerase
VTFETIRLEVDERGVAALTLARPDAANAISLQLATELLDAATALHADSSVRAVLVRGEGRLFCGGGDLKAFAAVEPDALPGHLREITTALHAALVKLARLDAPVVAAVHGSAAGAGFSLACAADVVVAADTARFVLAYAGVGLTPDGSATFFLPRVVGLRRAQELVLLNRALSAAEAREWGIVTEVVPEAELVPRADELAARLASGPTRSLGAAKRLLWSSFDTSLETQLERETESLSAAAATADGREGVAAFVAKRSPRFTGR